jgi:hypothetical protein
MIFRALLLLPPASLALLLLGCPIYSSEHPRGVSRRASCRQAYEQGWCHDGCRKKPETCCEPKNVRCGPSGICVWEGCNGSLIFGAIGQEANR